MQRTVGGQPGGVVALGVGADVKAHWVVEFDAGHADDAVGAVVRRALVEQRRQDAQAHKSGGKEGPLQDVLPFRFQPYSPNIGWMPRRGRRFRRGARER